MVRDRVVAFAAVLTVVCLTIGTAWVLTQDAVAKQTKAPATGNQTQQENPFAIEDGEHSDQTTAWLASQLGSRLQNGSISSSNAQYE